MNCTRFTGRRALITGGARGIGAATAQRLSAEGARVVIADRDAEGAARVAAELPGSVGIGCDVRSTDDTRAAVAAALSHFGGLDLLVNNAYSCSPDTDDAAAAEAAWDLDLDVTLSGAYRCIVAAFDALAASETGNVVSVGSVNGRQNYGNHAYSAAKAGLESLTRTKAAQGGPLGIRVNAVIPGTVATPAWSGNEDALDRVVPGYPLGRVGRPEDIAAAIAFLGSEDAAWITGTSLCVDGGLLAANPWFQRAAAGE